MKKIFSFFAAILFTGSMMAGETATATLTKGNLNSYDNVTINEKSAVKMGKNGAGGNMTISVGAGATSLTFHAAAWNADGDVTLDITAPTGVTVTPASVTALKNSGLAGTGNTFTVTPEADYEITVAISGASAATTLGIATSGSGSKRVFVWDATYEWEAVTDPFIAADDIDLGILYIEPGQSKLEDYEINFDVTSDNLTEDIDISLPAVTGLTVVSPNPAVIPANSTAPVLLRLTAGEGVIDEQVVLISGSTTKTVAITGEIQVRLYNPGTGVTDAEIVTPEASDTAWIENDTHVAYTVNGQNAIKVGTSKYLGVAKIKVPADAKKLYVMAAAWAQKAARITVTGPAGVTISSDSINAQGNVYLYADAGLTGEGPDYNTTGADQALYQYEFDLSDLTGETTIEFASTSRSTARFFIWNATYETSTPTAIDETEAAGKATKELREGQVLIIKGNKTYNILGQEIR